MDDVTLCLSQLGERALSAEELPFVLNVAGPEPVSIRRLAQEIGEQAGVEPRFRPAPRARDADLIADITSLRGLTRPRFTPFAEALARTLAELRG